MKGFLIALVAASCLAVPQQADAFVGGFFARRAVVNAQIVRNRRINQVLAAQAVVHRNQFVAPVVVQRQFVPLQRQPVIVNGFNGGYGVQGFRQPIVVQQLGVGGRCSGFFR